MHIYTYAFMYNIFIFIPQNDMCMGLALPEDELDTVWGPTWCQLGANLDLKTHPKWSQVGFQKPHLKPHKVHNLKPHKVLSI